MANLEEDVELVVVQVLVVLPLARYLLEESLSACSVVCQRVRQHVHSRASLRQVATSLPSHAAAIQRRRLWRRLCVAGLPLSEREGAEEYDRLAELESAMDCEIRRDIGRTFPEDFAESEMEALFRVLRAVSHRVEDVRYCQGMNFVVGTFLRVFGVDAEALIYQCSLSILLRHGMNQFFGLNFPKLRLVALQFDCLVEAFLPDLGRAFEVYNIGAEYYATQWFLTLFSYSLPFPYVVRVWDQFLCRGFKFIHRVGLALLQQARKRLRDMPFDGMVKELKSLGQHLTLTPEELIAEAACFKVTNRLLCELEHALAMGGGAQQGDRQRSMPCLFAERNLDSGKVRWRVVASSDAGAPGSPEQGHIQRETVSTLSSVEETFVDSALPAPRVPTDPYAPEIMLPPRLAEVNEALPPKGKSGPLKGRLKKLPAAFRRGGAERGVASGRGAKTPKGQDDAQTPSTRSTGSRGGKNRMGPRRSMSVPASRQPRERSASGRDASVAAAAVSVPESSASPSPLHHSVAGRGVRSSSSSSSSSSCRSIDSEPVAAPNKESTSQEEAGSPDVKDVSGTVFTVKDLDTGVVNVVTDERSGAELCEQLSPKSLSREGSKQKSTRRKPGLLSRTLRRSRSKDALKQDSLPLLT
mmetsp:Transcript_52218/g.124491  ORF Transcript_52218/g.124491 Transcript_52218/m.124491 type:complete len:640 (+) Transcript_52218:112-2031(+)